ncbi:MAG: TIGR03936 family radical SAM-associated protein, partial [Prochlorococcaceae cyanobacterium]
ALALPLGAEGVGEWFDLEFAQPIDPEQALQGLAAQLPDGLTLPSVQPVPVRAPSLSQELEAAVWRIAFAPTDPLAAPLAAAGAWQQAIAALLARDTLIWHDTDKKGRPRQRDCRPLLRHLELLAAQADLVSLRLEAAIDGKGRSLRPEQLQHWLAGELGRPLRLQGLCREALQLRPC